MSSKVLGWMTQVSQEEGSNARVGQHTHSRLRSGEMLPWRHTKGFFFFKIKIGSYCITLACLELRRPPAFPGTGIACTILPTKGIFIPAHVTQSMSTASFGILPYTCFHPPSTMCTQLLSNKPIASLELGECQLDKWWVFWIGGEGQGDKVSIYI